jgi:hypothetical protein
MATPSQTGVIAAAGTRYKPVRAPLGPSFHQTISP